MRKAEETVDPLAALLRLPASERTDRGLLYTPGEIAQQPATWRETYRRLRPRVTQIREFLEQSGVRAAGERRPVVFLVGAGTSDYIGRSLWHLLRAEWQCEVFPVPSPDLLTDFSEFALPGRPYLWISFSRSGDSPEGVAVVERAIAERAEIRHLVISCNSSGRLLRAIEGRPHMAVQLDESTNDRGLAMTSSFTNMVIAGQMLAHAWTIDTYEPICHRLADAAQQLIPLAAALAAELAEKQYTRVCFVGSGVLAGAATESALKLLELTAGNVQAFAQSTLSLRHGPMAAIDADTLFVSLVASQPQRRNYDLDLLREVGDKSLGRTRLAIATSDLAGLGPLADAVLAPERSYDIPDFYRPVLDVIFGQLLGMFASLQFGLKPDAPSPSGAINRVVQNVEIY